MLCVFLIPVPTWQSLHADSDTEPNLDPVQHLWDGLKQLKLWARHQRWTSLILLCLNESKPAQCKCRDCDNSTLMPMAVLWNVRCAGVHIILVALYLTSSASDVQSSSTQHPVTTQYKLSWSLCPSSLRSQMESVGSASLHTHQYFKDALTHSSRDETSLGRILLLVSFCL